MLSGLATLILVSVSNPVLGASPSGHLPLPAPRGPLVFDPGTKEVGLDVLLRTLAELTGQELALSPREAQVLSQTREALESTAPVPAEEVYAFVEGLLAGHGVVLTPLTGGTRPILGVYVQAPASPVPDPLAVGLEHLSELAGHPALLVRLVLPLENLDARQVQTQLRQITVDPSGVTQVVPIGERVMLLQGRAKDVTGLVQVLRIADEHAGHLPRTPAPAAAAEGGK